jgi:hypothetical protein
VTTLVEGILLLVVVEALALGWLLRRRGSHRLWLTVQLNLAAGAFLLLGVRAAQAGSTLGLLLALAAALSAHLCYLAVEIRGGRGG